MRLAWMLITCVGCAACGGDGLRGDVASLRAEMAMHDARLAETEAAAERLSARWHYAATAYADVAREYDAAAREYARASDNAHTASGRFRAAAATWERARQRWDRVRDLVQIAAMLDANALDTRRTDLRDLGSCETTSTSSYRRHLEAEGRDLTGMHIDHIVPHALGGADNALNYRVIPAAENLAWSDTWNVEKCLDAGSQCVLAMLVSTQCGTFGGP